MKRFRQNFSENTNTCLIVCLISSFLAFTFLIESLSNWQANDNLQTFMQNLNPACKFFLGLAILAFLVGLVLELIRVKKFLNHLGIRRRAWRSSDLFN